MKTLEIPNETGQNAEFYGVDLADPNSPDRSSKVQFDRPKVRQEVRRVFHFQIGEMNVSVHPGQDLEPVRVLKSNPLRYFIDDVEVDQETFDRELEQE